MRVRPSRVGCLILALLATLWALFLVPQQAVLWSGADVPRWMLDVTRTPFYAAVRDGLADLGLRDLYLVFGAAIGLSLVLLWFALGPTLARVGWAGRVYGGLLLLLALVTVLSYLNHAEHAPLHFLWGLDGIVLVALGVWGIVAAFAPGSPRLPLWEALLLGLSLPIFFLGMLALAYWPHGPAAALGLVAAALALWAPRPDSEPAGESEAAVRADAQV